MERVILVLGSNIGDTKSRIDHAVELIAERGGRVINRSTMITSEPWGFEDREDTTPLFTNQAVEIECDLSPDELLSVTQLIEQEVGRERDVEQKERVRRGEKYASRKIDIDIILYSDKVHKSDRLTLPHPLMQEREFVLIPIVEIAPDWLHPSLGKSCKELLMELKRENICRE